MTLEQSRRKILDLWKTEHDHFEREDIVSFFQSARSFYTKLKRNDSQLLAFSCFGDKWEIVNRWLVDYETDGHC